MTKREKNLLFVAVLIVMVAVYSTMVLPYLGETDVVLAETAVLQDQIAKQNRKLEEIPRLEQEYEDNLSQLEEQKHSYGAVQTQEEIATYFTKLVEREGLEITAFAQTRTSKLLTSGGIDLFPAAEVTLTCGGTHEAFISMMDALNQKEDIIVLSVSQKQTDSEISPQEYTIACLLMMNAE